MMYGLLVIILSLVTCVAGHYLNRRWDRAALFLGLFLIWQYLPGLIAGDMATELEPTSQAELTSYMESYAATLGIGTVCLLVLSSLIRYLGSE